MSGLRPRTSESAPRKPTNRKVQILSSASTSPPTMLEAGDTLGEPSALTTVEMTRPSTGMTRPRARKYSQLASIALPREGAGERRVGASNSWQRLTT